MIIVCTRCGGAGTVITFQTIIPPITIRSVCPECRGVGTVERER